MYAVILSRSAPSYTISDIDPRIENSDKNGIYENCEVSCAIWEEIFEDIDDTLKDLKATDDIIRSDITRLNGENIDQNTRIEAVEGTAEENAGALNVTNLEMDTLKASNELLNNQYNVLDSKIKAVEGRLDILEGDAGPGTYILASF